MHKDRRIPLADLVMRSDLHNVLSNVASQLKTKIRSANRFILDASAASRVGEVSRDVPELLLEHQTFARTPYDLMWLEAPSDIIWETVNPHQKQSTWIDQQVGWLIDHGTVHTFVQSNHHDRADIVPYCYHLHCPWEVQDQARFLRAMNCPNLIIDQFLWGAAYTRLDDNNRQGLRRRHSCTLFPGITPELKHSLVNHKHLGADLLKGAYGDLRNIIATLLILNRPSLIQYLQDIPPRRSFLHGKLHNFMHHRVVTIQVDPRPVIRKIGTTEDATPRRRHEVRGHWCHNQDARDYRTIGCAHDWVPDPDYAEPENERDHLICAVCAGKRWWRHEHARGSAGLGSTTKDYYVQQ